MSEYAKVKPVGQHDKYSCWAACLSWWTKAINHSNKKTQTQLIQMFDNGLLTDENGAILPFALANYVFPTFNLELRTINSGELSQYTFTKPVLMIYVNPSAGGMHMNVIFDTHLKAGDGGAGVPEQAVMCMEPAYPLGAKDGKRTGAILSRPNSYFTQLTPQIRLGVPKS